MRRGLALALCLIPLLSSCSANRPKPSEDAAAASGSSNPTESLALEVRLTDQTTTGRIMKLRAQIVNNHDEVVTGVRVQLVFLMPSDEDTARILEIQQKEMGGSIPPGESAMLRWDVESQYLSGDGRFIVAAYPKRLGDKDLPPPDNWTE